MERGTGLRFLRQEAPPGEPGEQRSTKDEDKPTPSCEAVFSDVGAGSDVLRCGVDYTAPTAHRLSVCTLPRGRCRKFLVVSVDRARSEGSDGGWRHSLAAALLRRGLAAAFCCARHSEGSECAEDRLSPEDQLGGSKFLPSTGLTLSVLRSSRLAVRTSLGALSLPSTSLTLSVLRSSRLARGGSEFAEDRSYPECTGRPQQT